MERKDNKTNKKNKNEYARVVREVARKHRIHACCARGRKWFKHAIQGFEAIVYVDEGMTRVLKKFVVSLEEDPVARFEAIARVNAAASAHGISPALIRVYYEMSDRGVLFFCIESEYFEGRSFDELAPAERRRVATLIRAHAKKMVRCGIWHGDLHGGNILVAEDLSRVAFIDFGNGCFVMDGNREAVVALALRKLG